MLSFTPEKQGRLTEKRSDKDRLVVNPQIHSLKSQAQVGVQNSEAEKPNYVLSTPKSIKEEGRTSVASSANGKGQNCKKSKRKESFENVDIEEHRKLVFKRIFQG